MQTQPIKPSIIDLSELKPRVLHGKCVYRESELIELLQEQGYQVNLRGDKSETA